MEENLMCWLLSISSGYLAHLGCANNIGISLKPRNKSSHGLTNQGLIIAENCWLPVEWTCIPFYLNKRMNMTVWIMENMHFMACSFMNLIHENPKVDCLSLLLPALLVGVHHKTYFRGNEQKPEGINQLIKQRCRFCLGSSFPQKMCDNKCSWT